MTRAAETDGATWPAGAARGGPDRAGRVGLVLALASLLLWYGLVGLRRPTPLGDEHYHYPAVLALARGDWEPVRALPMPPTYHLLAAGVVRLLGPHLAVVRGLSLVMGLAAVLLLWAAARRLCPRLAPWLPLLLAWNPLLLPYWALVYTDPVALVALLAALNLHLRHHRVGAGLALLAACAVRQTNVVWVAFFLAWEFFGDDPAGTAGGVIAALCRALAPARLRRLWPYFLAAAGGLVIWWRAPAGTTYVAVVTTGYNPAQLVMLGLMAALLWAPCWCTQLADWWPRGLAQHLLRPTRLAALTAAAGVLMVTFRNPHPWNLDLSFLRNWPLYALTHSFACRAVVAPLIVVSVLGLVWGARRDTRCASLALLALFTLVFVLPHYLVDPRYYVFPFVLTDLLVTRGARQLRQQLAWYALLTIGVGLFIVGRSGGGVW